MDEKQSAATVYFHALKRLGPEGRLRKAFELSDLTKKLFILGLRKKHPDLPEKEFKQLLFEKIDRCRNLNY